VLQKQVRVAENDLEKLVNNASMRLPLGRLKQLNKNDIEAIFKIAY
jgi:hypothetical protein